MKVLEMSKKYVEEYYNNNFYEAIKNLDGVLFDDLTIKAAFRNGSGKVSDLKRYINNNRLLCKYYDLKSGKFI